MINCGEASSRAGLSRLLGVSRSRVTQLLGPLRLADEVMVAIDRLGDPLSEPTFTERHLRVMTRFDRDGQIGRFEFLCGRRQSPESP